MKCLYASMCRNQEHAYITISLTLGLNNNLKISILSNKNQV